MSVQVKSEKPTPFKGGSVTKYLTKENILAMIIIIIMLSIIFIPILIAVFR